MTETAAQIMAEGIVYPHVQVKINTHNILEVKSDALLTGYGIMDPNGDIILKDPKNSAGWFATGDLAKWNKNGRLEILGRAENVIKVSGEIVNLQRLNQLFDDAKLNAKFQGNAILKATKDERLGYKIVVESDSNCEQAINHYNQRCLPFEKVVSL
jgi:O-succinylbenzoic acid--CoA ligase